MKGMAQVEVKGVTGVTQLSWRISIQRNVFGKDGPGPCVPANGQDREKRRRDQFMYADNSTGKCGDASGCDGARSVPDTLATSRVVVSTR